MNHDMDVEALGKHLESKDIALLITGCIASYKSPSLVRHFRQYGANVHVYSTPEAMEYVTEKVTSKYYFSKTTHWAFPVTFLQKPAFAGVMQG